MGRGKHEEWVTDVGLVQLESFARDGLTDVQIAEKMGISKTTLYEYKKKFPEISESLKRGKEVVDAQVEDSLLKRALGYSYEKEVKERKYNDQTGKYELVVVKSTTVEVQPDTTAQIFWLKNRMPEKWRDKREVNVEGSLDTTKELTDEELEEEIRKAKKKLGVGDG